MSPRISVILTTYNRASIISSMIEGILNQTMHDFELIIVNDGSTDNTATIINKYACNDKRVICINKENGGLGNARNTGIEIAKGKFITFVDDDDTLKPDYLESMLNEEYEIFDLIIDSYSNQIDNEEPIKVNFPQKVLLSRQEALKYIFGDLQKVPYCFFAWAKRYRTEIIRKKNIRFSSTIQFVEDRPFVLDYLRHSNSLIINNSGGYIARSSSNAEYRLSNPVKPADYLCQNIFESYLFLCHYAKEMNMDKINAYADNYLIDKVFVYLLQPLATGQHPITASDSISFTFRNLIEKINIDFVKNRERLFFVRLFITHPGLTVKLLQTRIKLGKLLRILIK